MQQVLGFDKQIPQSGKDVASRAHPSVRKRPSCDFASWRQARNHLHTLKSHKTENSTSPEGQVLPQRLSNYLPTLPDSKSPTRELGSKKTSRCIWNFSFAFALPATITNTHPNPHTKKNQKREAVREAFFNLTQPPTKERESDRSPCVSLLLGRPMGNIVSAKEAYQCQIFSRSIDGKSLVERSKVSV
jgi:hypothetical protein